jgi:hypothetical protein
MPQAIEDINLDDNALLDSIYKDLDSNNNANKDNSKDSRSKKSELEDENLEELEELEDEELEELEDEDEDENEDLESNEEDIEDSEKSLNRPSVSEIIKKYPELFKDFPGIKDSYFAEKAYRDLFGSVESAKEVREQVNLFNDLSDSILSGDSKPLVSALKDASEESLAKFSQSILPAIHAVDKQAHYNIVAELIQNVLVNVYNSNDENDRNAALVLAEYLFSNEDVATGKVKVVDNNKKDPAIESEQQKFYEERRNIFVSDVSSEVKQSLESIINHKKDGKSVIDPEGKMSKLSRDAIIFEINKRLDAKLSKDSTHLSHMRSLWRYAEREKYGLTSKSQLTNAYLARAKKLIPSIRSEVITEFNGANDSNKLNNLKNTNNRKESFSSSKPESNSKGKYDPKSVDYSKTSDLDILNDNITFKNRR